MQLYQTGLFLKSCVMVNKQYTRILSVNKISLSVFVRMLCTLFAVYSLHIQLLVWHVCYIYSLTYLCAFQWKAVTDLLLLYIEYIQARVVITLSLINSIHTSAAPLH